MNRYTGHAGPSAALGTGAHAEGGSRGTSLGSVLTAEGGQGRR